MVGSTSHGRSAGVSPVARRSGPSLSLRRESSYNAINDTPTPFHRNIVLNTQKCVNMMFLASLTVAALLQHAAAAPDPLITPIAELSPRQDKDPAQLGWVSKSGASACMIPPVQLNVHIPG